MNKLNKKRKAALQKRAWKYAHRRYPVVIAADVAEAFEDGYRAAMRDARKAVKPAEWGLPDWLRPLR